MEQTIFFCIAVLKPCNSILKVVKLNLTIRTNRSFVCNLRPLNFISTLLVHTPTGRLASHRKCVALYLLVFPIWQTLGDKPIHFSAFT